VDGFALVMFGGIGAIALVLYLLGRFYPGSGADVLGWDPRELQERKLAAEAEDLEQMLEARNARRRARGEAELTEEDLHRRVAEDRRAAERRRDAYLADEDERQMRAALAERRAARAARRARDGGGTAPPR